MNDVKNDDYVNCSACKSLIKKDSFSCPYCKTIVSNTMSEKVKTEYNKSKTTAIILAVFLGFWSWLYTYGKNAIKFWVVIAILCVIPVVFYGIFSTLSAMSAYNYFMGIVGFGIWLWCLIDNATKDNDFYKYITKKRK